jgi:hypothetical protein
LKNFEKTFEIFEKLSILILLVFNKQLDSLKTII